MKIKRIIAIAGVVLFEMCACAVDLQRNLTHFAA
jgi:hypothetical protein